MALSTADINKWISLLNRGSSELVVGTSESQDHSEEKGDGLLRQRQRRLAEANVAKLATRDTHGRER